MQGWRILKHSWVQVTANFNAAIRISLVLHLATVAGSLYFTSAVGDGLNDGTWVLMDDIWFQYAINMLVSSIGGLWIAVAWHRYILTGEISDGWLPKLYLEMMWGYFWRGILIAVTAIVSTSVIVGFLVIAAGIAFGGSSALSVIIPLIIFIPIIVVLFRLSPILPAIALGKTLSLKNSWKATKGSTGVIALFIAVFAIYYVVTANIVQPNIVGVSAFSILWDLVVGWIMTMFSISVLTTLYGHYVEGRELMY